MNASVGNSLTLIRTHWLFGVVAGSLLLLLTAVMLPSFVFFQQAEHYTALHSLLELASIVVACMVVFVGWSDLQGGRRSPLSAMLAGGFLAVVLLDIGHLLSYQGMPDFVTPSGPEKAINFWLAARFAAVLTLLAAAVLAGKGVSGGRLPWLLLGAGFSGLIFTTILFMPSLYPRTYVPGQGLTDFKIGAEYLLVGLYLLAAWLFFNNKAGLPVRVAQQLAAAAWIMALAELYFTLYEDVTDVFNLLGHGYKLVADYFVFRAVVQSSLKDPYFDLDRSQRHLRRAELELREILDLLPDVVFFYRMQAPAGFVYINASVARVLGFSQDEHYRNPYLMLDRIHPEDRRFLEIVMASERPPARTEMRWINHKGETIWLEQTLAPRYDADGVLVGVAGVGRDVSTRRALENRLRDSDRIHRTVLASMSDGVVVHGADGQVLQANPAAEKILGLSKAQILGGEFFGAHWHAVHEDGSTIGGEQHPAMITLRTGVAQHSVLIGMRKRVGGTRWLRINTDPQLEPGSNVVSSVVSTFRDVSDDERRRRELENRYGHVSVAQSMIGCGSWSWELTSGRVDWSPGIYRLFAMNPGTAPELRRIWRLVHPDDRDAVREQIARLRLGGGSRQFELRLRLPDGSLHHILNVCRIVHSPGGGVRQIIGALQDITEHRADGEATPVSAQVCG